MEDSLWSGLTDSHAGLPMGMTAENLAEKVTNLHTAKLNCNAARLVREPFTFSYIRATNHIVVPYRMLKDARKNVFIFSEQEHPISCSCRIFS